MNFWEDLLQQTPIISLSPMDGVTDAPMRYMSAKYGRPMVVFTEFISVDALAHAKEPQSVDRVMRAFVRAQDVGPLESRPYEIAQVFGHTPELFYQAAIIIAALGYDGMDINMGCPSHKVEEHGSGAGLIRTPEVAKEIVRASKRAMREYAAGTISVDDLAISPAIKEWVHHHQQSVSENGGRHELPVSLKTRIGVDSIVVEYWMEHLMQVEPAMISLHGRTLKQLYQGSADWEAIGRASTVVHKLGGHIMGNGDVLSVADGTHKAHIFGLDGFLIGRAAEGNPGIFARNDEPTQSERMNWLLEHTRVYEQVNRPTELAGNNHHWFVPMRKHLAWYCKGFPGASEIRDKLVRSSSLREVEAIIGDIISS